jgi:hypothetical protein
VPGRYGRLMAVRTGPVFFAAQSRTRWAATSTAVPTVIAAIGPPVREIGIAFAAGVAWARYRLARAGVLCDYLFSHTPAQRIQAGTHPENVAEQKALEKAGFQLEGVVRACEFRAGRWRDGLLYSRLRPRSPLPTRAGRAATGRGPRCTESARAAPAAVCRDNDPRPRPGAVHRWSGPGLVAHSTCPRPAESRSSASPFPVSRPAPTRLGSNGGCFRLKN